MRRPGAALLPCLVVAIAGVKCLLWTLSLPPWYGPDEPAHFSYVQLLAIKHVVPYGVPLGETVLPPEVTCSEGRLGFRSDGPFFAEPPWGPDTPPACPEAADPRLPADDGNPAGDYLPVYYGLGVLAWEAAADQPVETRLHAVRLLSALLGVVATAFTYLAGYWFFGGRQALAASAALVFAFQPIASQQFAIVNNDALLIAVAAAFSWLLARSLARGAGPRDLLVLGLVGGAAYLAKPQGALLLAAVPLPLLLGPSAARRTARGLWPRLLALVRGLLPAAAAGGALIATGLLLGLALHGRAGPHPIPVAPGPHGIRSFLALYLGDAARYPYFLFISSFWGLLAWLEIPAPVAVMIGAAAAYAVAAVGVAIAAARGLVERAQTASFALALFGVALLVILLELAYYRTYGERILQGRSFMFLMPVLAILLTAGLAAWAPRRCLGAAAASVAVLALLVNVLSLFQLWSYLYR